MLMLKGNFDMVGTGVVCSKICWDIAVQIFMKFSHLNLNRIKRRTNFHFVAQN